MKQTFVVVVIGVFAAVPAVFAGPTSICRINVLQNPGFAVGLNIVGNGAMPPSTTANWTPASLDPLLGMNGCGSPGFVAMWGNQTFGQAIQQKLDRPLMRGTSYRFSACVRAVNPSPSPVQFRVRASSGPLTSYTAPGAVIGVTQPITSTEWTRVVLPVWTAGALSLDTITISPENQFAVKDSTKVSWGHIDGVCLEPIEQLQAGSFKTQPAYGSYQDYQVQRTAEMTVGAGQLGDALTQLAGPAASPSCHAPGCNSTYYHSTPLWAGSPTTSFLRTQLPAFLEQAEKIAKAHVEMCQTTRKVPVAYRFRSAPIPNTAGMGLFVEIDYGICGTGLPN